MAKETEERKLIKALSKGQKAFFAEITYRKVTRCVQDLNKCARADRLVETDQVLYSLIVSDAPKGQFYVIRNY